MGKVAPRTFSGVTDGVFAATKKGPIRHARKTARATFPNLRVEKDKKAGLPFLRQTPI